MNKSQKKGNRGCVIHLLEKFRDTNMVVKMAPLSLRLALNFFKQSTVSWRWTMLATRSRCCSSKEKIVSRAFWPASRLVAFFYRIEYLHRSRGAWAPHRNGSSLRDWLSTFGWWDFWPQEWQCPIQVTGTVNNKQWLNLFFTGCTFSLKIQIFTSYAPALIWA